VTNIQYQKEKKTTRAVQVNKPDHSFHRTVFGDEVEAASSKAPSTMLYEDDLQSHYSSFSTENFQLSLR
jgi:hypothetical protein